MARSCTAPHDPEAESAYYADVLGWTEEESAWLTDFMDASVSHHASCGAPFGEREDADRHGRVCPAAREVARYAVKARVAARVAHRVKVGR